MLKVRDAEAVLWRVGQIMRKGSFSWQFLWLPLLHPLASFWNSFLPWVQGYVSLLLFLLCVFGFSLYTLATLPFACPLNTDVPEVVFQPSLCFSSCSSHLFTCIFTCLLPVCWWLISLSPKYISFLRRAQLSTYLLMFHKYYKFESL